MTQFDPAKQTHWRFTRQTGLRRADFRDDPPGFTIGDALVLFVSVLILMGFISFTCM